MEKKHLIGKKVRGFEFNATDSGLFFVDEMTEYNGRIGTTLEIVEDDVRVEFEDGKKFRYPLDQIEQHLVDDTPSQYEVGMTVYDAAFGEGRIGGSVNYPISVDFERDSKVYTSDGRQYELSPRPTLSLTPYDPINGGATFPTFKPELPEIEKGALVYVNTGFMWHMRFFSHFDDSGNIYCFINQEKSGKAESWADYSLTNPLIKET